MNVFDLNSIANSHVDVTVVGGGMVGATLALAFLKEGKSVLLLEQQLPEKKWLENPPLRVSAINLASEALLQSLDIWRHIAPSHRCMFNQLATWESGDNKLVFDAQDLKKSHLGHLIRNEAIQIAAFDVIEMQNNYLEPLTNTTIKQLIQHDGFVELELISNDKIINVTSSMVVAADGAQSKLRALCHIGTTGWEYRQRCFSITINTEFPTQHITWQEFQLSGPKAFLPLEDGNACLIWYDAPNTIAELEALSEQALKSKIIEVFPALPGDFSIVQSASFPLVRQQANTYYNGRVVLVGDAAHVINPLAGQGVNLGFKDIATLTNFLKGIDLNDKTVLLDAFVRYQRNRKMDAQIISSAMDLFYQVFSQDIGPIRGARNLVLSLVQNNQWLKRAALKKAVGIDLLT